MIVIDASMLANVVGDDAEDGRAARDRIGDAGDVAMPDLGDVETVGDLVEEVTGGRRAPPGHGSRRCRRQPPRGPHPSRRGAAAHREAFGLNWDPSHMIWQQLDPVAFITDFADRIYHVDCKDTRMRMGGGRNGILSSHLPWADQRRGWDFVSAGRGDVPWEDCFRALRGIGYDGPISVEWEDASMDRLHGAAEALGFLKRFDYAPPSTAFDSVFDQQ